MIRVIAYQMKLQVKMISCFCLVVAMGTAGYAQGNLQTNIVPPSPQTYEMVKSGNLPIDYSTGGMNFNLPLYTIRAAGIEMPLSLSYTSNGVKVDLITSRAGNWNLNAGGAITRIIRGLPDEQGTFYDLQEIFGTTNGALNLAAAANPRLSGIDTERDWFMYNFNGYSGNFYIDDTLGVHVLSDTKLKFHAEIVEEPVIPTGDPNLPMLDRTNILKFTVTTPDGTKYEFGGQAYMERSFQLGFIVDDLTGYHGYTGGGFQLPVDYTTAFFLKQVTSNTGGQIIFHYVDDNYKFVSQVSQTAVLSRKQGIDIIGGGSGSGAPEESLLYEKSGKTYWRNFVRSRAIFNIEVRQPDGALISSINFINSRSGITNAMDYFYTSGLSDRVVSDSVVWKTIFANSYEASPVFGTIPASLHTDKISVFNNENQLVETYNLAYSVVSGRQYLDSVSFLGRSNSPDPQRKQVYRFEYNDRAALPAPHSFSQDYYGFYNGKLNSNLVVRPQPGEYAGISDAFISTLSNVFGDRAPVSTYVSLGMLKKIIYPTQGHTEITYEPNYGPGRKLFGGARVRYVRDFDGLKYSREREFYYDRIALFPSTSSSLQETNEPRFFDKMNALDTSYNFEFSMSSTAINSLYHNRKARHLYAYVSEIYRDAEGKPVGATERSYFTEADPYPYAVQGTLLLSTPSSNLDIWKSQLLERERKYIYGQSNTFELKEETAFEYIKRNEERFMNHVVVLTTPGSPTLPKSYSVNSYEMMTCDYRKSKQVATIYTPGGNMVQETVFTYSDDGRVQLKEQNTHNSREENQTTKFTYVQDLPSPSPAEQLLLAQHRISEPVITENFVNNQRASIVRLTYKDWGNGIVKPEVASTKIGDYNTETKVFFNAYDRNGNLLEQQKEHDVREVYLWGYNGQYPVAKIIGTDLATASGLVNATVLENAGGIYNNDQVRLELNKLRTGAGAADRQVNTFTYQPLVGMTSQTNPANKTTFYEYDQQNRLIHIRDNDLNILKKNDYIFADPLPGTGITYYNVGRVAQFYKDNCGSNQMGLPYTYTVAAGVYTSLVSQSDADQKAQKEIDSLGQINANLYGNCGPAPVPGTTYYNTGKSVSSFSNACISGVPLRNTYTVPAGLYSSTISQADADRKASNDIHLNGQAHINALSGSCAKTLPAPWDGTIFDPQNQSSYSYAKYYYTTTLVEMKAKLQSPEEFGPVEEGIFQSSPDVKYIATYFYPNNYVVHMIYDGFQNTQFAPDGYYLHIANIVNGQTPAEAAIYHLEQGQLVKVNYFPTDGTIFQ